MMMPCSDGLKAEFGPNFKRFVFMYVMYVPLACYVRRISWKILPSRRCPVWIQAKGCLWNRRLWQSHCSYIGDISSTSGTYSGRDITVKNKEGNARRNSIKMKKISAILVKDLFQAIRIGSSLQRSSVISSRPGGGGNHENKHFLLFSSCRRQTCLVFAKGSVPDSHGL